MVLLVDKIIYLLRNSAQQCLFPHPWLKLLKCIIDYNTLSVKVNAEPGSFLSAEGKLSHDNLHWPRLQRKPPVGLSEILLLRFVPSTI